MKLRVLHLPIVLAQPHLWILATDLFAELTVQLGSSLAPSRRRYAVGAHETEQLVAQRTDIIGAKAVNDFTVGVLDILHGDIDSLG